MTDNGASKIYTRGGDKGKTSLIGGTRVSKSDLRLDAYGTIDELNSWLGVLRTEASGSPALSEINEIQNDLFNVGSQLACEDKSMRATLPGISDEKIKDLELWMDRYSKDLAPLKNFILPGGTKAASYAHIARTVARRAERAIVRLSETTDSDPSHEVDANVVKFVNRLSDYFFVLARHFNHEAKCAEPVWGAKIK